MATTGTGRAAGTYAQERYARGRRRWRVRTLPILAATFGPLILVGIVGLILERHLLSWLAGALAGAGVAAWGALRETPPAYVEKWQLGAEGERKTAAALTRLEGRGLTVVHDVDCRYGNYDHIAVGPGGVFLLESKYPQGTVELRGGVPHLRRKLDPEADTPIKQIRPRVLSAAAALKRDIEQRTGVRTWVQAVVVLWCDFPEGVIDDGRCVFVHGPRLANWIEGRPSGLSRANVEAIVAAVREIDRSEMAG